MDISGKLGNAIIGIAAGSFVTMSGMTVTNRVAIGKSEVRIEHNAEIRQQLTQIDNKLDRALLDIAKLKAEKSND